MLRSRFRLVRAKLSFWQLEREMGESDRQTGRIVRFGLKEGYGFIRPDYPAPDVFFSIWELPKGSYGVSIDQRVSYLEKESSQGLRAKKVEFIDIW